MENRCVSAYRGISLGSNTYVISRLTPGISRVVNPFIGVRIGEFCGTGVGGHISEAVKNVSQYSRNNIGRFYKSPCVSRAGNGHVTCD